MKLGVFTVSVPEWDPIETLRILSEMGYDGVQWRVYADKPQETPGFWRGNRCSMSAEQIIQRADELKAKAAESKLEMPSLAAYVSCDDLAAVELHLQAAKAIGAKACRIGTPGYDAEKGDYYKLLKSSREQFAQVAKLAAKYGVRAITEIHPGLITTTMSKCRAVLDGLDPKHVGIIWDVCNQVSEGLETYRMALDIGGPFLHEVHVKNCRWVTKGNEGKTVKWVNEPCPIWEGIVDWPAVIKTLKEFGYNGWLHFEDFSTAMPLRQRTKENHDYIRSLL